MKITIPGRPIPAVRMTRRGVYKKEYAQRYLDYKTAIGMYARIKCKEPTEKYVIVDVRVYLYGIKGFGNAGDVDNYLKSSMDGLNGIAWLDDRQVVKATVQKLWCEKKDERMEIEIYATEGD